MATNTLSKEHKEFILRKLAAREPPREIVANFLAMFPGAGCDENDVRRLMPTNTVLPPDLFAFYQEARERFKSDPEAAPYRDQDERIRILSGDVDFLRGNNQRALAWGVLRQIAEELGVLGAKGKAASAKDAAAEGEDEVGSITRVIVDPKKQKEGESDEQTK